MPEIIKVILVEDNRSYVEGLMALFQSDDRVHLCGAASNFHTLIDLVREQQPEVVLMDYDLRSELLDGVEMAEKLLPEFPDLKIIMLTNYDDPPIVENALRKGIQGYLLKDRSRREIKLAIETVASGLMVVEKSLFHAPKPKPPKPPNGILTRSEHAIACLISKGLSSKEISEQQYISVNTVDTHRKNIYAKLDVHNAVELANKLRSLGIEG
jgi:DNA-binding NarL/FixJ family response regulator